MAPEDITRATVNELASILKKPGVRKRPFLVRTEADVFSAAANMAAGSLAPIFLVSSVDGRGLDRLRCFLNLLPQRVEWGCVVPVRVRRRRWLTRLSCFAPRAPALARRSRPSSSSTTCSRCRAWAPSWPAPSRRAC